MKVHRWSSSLRTLGESVCAIGVFDGVHLGHQVLLRAAVTDARARGCISVALTFDRDPDQVVTPDRAAPQLLTLSDKLRYMEETEVDEVLIVPFDNRIAALRPEAFIEGVLSASMRPLAVHVGRDFRFGARAEGSVETLEAWGERAGVAVHAQRLLEIGGGPVTSTRIRALVESGKVEEAAALLGRPTRVHGTVRHGRGIGASMGVATANLDPLPFAALPADGVYAGTAEVSGTVWRAGISVGTPPTFPEASDRLEAHLIGFRGDLYGAEVTLGFVARLHEQRAHPDPGSLAAAIAADLREVARVVPLRA